jgi:hypothetical protein
MRTTIDLPDPLFRRAKAAASLKGLSLKSFIGEALEHELQAERAVLGPGQHVKLPLVPSGAPGSRALTPERAAELLEQEDLHVPPGR